MNGTRMIAWALGVCCAAAVSMPLRAGTTSEPRLLQAGPLEKSPQSGAEQLKAAHAVKKRSFKKEGDEKRGILLEAVEAYRLVKRNFADDRKSCALASLRIGEILRSLKETDEARAAFQDVLTYPEETNSVAKAMEELAHFHRRDKDWEMAIRMYSQIPQQCPGERAIGARATLWVAKCHRTRKALDDAAGVLEKLIDEYEDEEATLLSAFDLLATIFIEQNAIDRAKQVLEECKAHFLTGASDSTDDVAWETRIQKMKAWKLLAEKS